MKLYIIAIILILAIVVFAVFAGVKINNGTSVSSSTISTVLTTVSQQQNASSLYNLSVTNSSPALASCGNFTLVALAGQQFNLTRACTWNGGNLSVVFRHGTAYGYYYFFGNSGGSGDTGTDPCGSTTTTYSSYYPAGSYNVTLNATAQQEQCSSTSQSYPTYTYVYVSSVNITNPGFGKGFGK